jgi:hypothetical protein
MAKPSKTEKFFAAQITGFYSKHSQGKNINIMDIKHVHAAALSQIPNGLPAVEAAVVAAIAKYCKPV